ncbi:MAG: hypothetical protein ACFE0O_04455 [Opitutales bacterium]
MPEIKVNVSDEAKKAFDGLEQVEQGKCGELVSDALGAKNVGQYDRQNDVVRIRKKRWDWLISDLESSPSRSFLLLLSFVPLPVFVLISWFQTQVAVLMGSWLGFAFYAVTVAAFLALPAVVALAMSRASGRF